MSKLESRRNRFVVGYSELDRMKALSGIQYVPNSAPKDCHIRFAVAVIIGSHRKIAGGAEPDGGKSSG